jgi:outer membrane protein assembly factor BamB
VATSLTLLAGVISAFPSGSVVSAASSLDWPTISGGPLHHGVSPDTTINATSAGTLVQKWSQLVGRTGNAILSTPTVVYNSTLKESLVYSVSDKGTMAAYNAATGALVWKDPLGGSIESTPTVYDGTIYVGNSDGVLAEINATTGVVDCNFDLPIVAPETVPGRVQATPIVGDVDGTGPTVFFGDEGQSEKENAGHFWAVTGQGNTAGACVQKWSFDNFVDRGPLGENGGSWDEPAVTKDSTGRWVVVFGSNQPDDAVYDLDASTGTEIWRFQTTRTGSDEDVGSGPTISLPGSNGFADGVVYVAGKDRIEYALDLFTGAQIWSYNLQQTPALASDEIEIAALNQDHLYVGFGPYVFELNASTGADIWKSAKVGVSFLASPVVTGGTDDKVVFLGNTSGGEYGYSARTGKELFSADTTHNITASAAVSGGMLYFADYTGTLYAYGLP